MQEDEGATVTTKRLPFTPPFRIVGIGASAGGLEALTALVANISATSGMAFIVLQHTTPDVPSQLTLLLSKIAKVEVKKAAHDMKMKPNVLYVAPSEFNVEVRETLRLIPRTANRWRPIDSLLRSIAETQGSQSGAVILSGMLSDGVEGLKLIHRAGGITFAQAPETSKFNDMPKNAIETGCVDYVLSPTEIGRQLSELEG